MSHHNEEFDLHVPLAAAMAACRHAIADLGWNILEQEETRLVAKERLLRASAIATFSAQVDIVLSSLTPTTTRVTLIGSVFGFGPLQSGHLAERVGNLRSRIELAAREQPAQTALTTPSTAETAPAIPGAPEAAPIASAAAETMHVAGTASASLADEIAKLGELHGQGVLSDAEFEQAKARLLNG